MTSFISELRLNLFRSLSRQTLQELLDAMDEYNASQGNDEWLCFACLSSEYDYGGDVGIIHKDTCDILLLRRALS